MTAELAESYCSNIAHQIRYCLPRVRKYQSILNPCKVYDGDSFNKFRLSAKVTKTKSHHFLGKGGLQALLIHDAKQACNHYTLLIRRDIGIGKL